MHPIYEQIRQSGVLPVINVPSPDSALPLCDALTAGGIPMIEVTLRNDSALKSIETIRNARPDMTVTAGTVRSPQLARDAVTAGAAGIVAPGFRRDVAEECLKLGVPYLPACVTGTELETALDLGITVVKYFPSETLGGIAALKLMHGAFPEFSFIVTGGITKDLLSSYLTQPFILACGGSFMARAELIKTGSWSQITEDCMACRYLADLARGH